MYNIVETCVEIFHSHHGDTQNVEIKKDTPIGVSLFLWLREEDSNFRPSGYEPDELPLLHPAIYRAPQRSHSIPHYTTKSQVFFSIYSILFPARYSPPRKAGAPKASRKKLCPFCPPSCRNGRGVV